MTLLFDGPTQRGDLIVIELRTGEPIADSDLAKKPVVCGFLLKDPGWSADWLRAVIRNLIENGAGYLSFWGVRCEEAHDIADCEREPFTPAGGEDVVMTTWHDDESLIDFLWYLAFLACPTEGFYNEPLRYLVVTVVQKSEPQIMGPVSEMFVS